MSGSGSIYPGPGTVDDYFDWNIGVAYASSRCMFAARPVMRISYFGYIDAVVVLGLLAGGFADPGHDHEAVEEAKKREEESEELVALPTSWW